MARINSKYTQILKLKIVKSYLNNEKSLQNLADEYGIKSKTQIYNWIKKYEEEGEDAFKFEKRGNPTSQRLVKDELIFEFRG